MSSLLPHVDAQEEFAKHDIEVASTAVDQVRGSPEGGVRVIPALVLPPFHIPRLSSLRL